MDEVKEEHFLSIHIRRHNTKTGEKCFRVSYERTGSDERVPRRQTNKSSYIIQVMPLHLHSPMTTTTGTHRNPFLIIRLRLMIRLTDSKPLKSNLEARPTESGPTNWHVAPLLYV